VQKQKKKTRKNGFSREPRLSDTLYSDTNFKINMPSSTKGKWRYIFRLLTNLKINRYASSKARLNAPPTGGGMQAAKRDQIRHLPAVGDLSVNAH